MDADDAGVAVAFVDDGVNTYCIPYLRSPFRETKQNMPSFAVKPIYNKTNYNFSQQVMRRPPIG